MMSAASSGLFARNSAAFAKPSDNMGPISGRALSVFVDMPTKQHR